MVKFNSEVFGLTNKLVNVALETYPLVVALPSEGLVATT